MIFTFLSILRSTVQEVQQTKCCLLISSTKEDHVHRWISRDSCWILSNSHCLQIYHHYQLVSKKNWPNQLIRKSSCRCFTWKLSKDSIDGSLWREANTRRPTLPPSALTFDGKTAAARKKNKRRKSFKKKHHRWLFFSYRWQHQEYHVGPAAFRWRKRFMLTCQNIQR